MSSQLTVLDTVDDRKELRTLLDHLTPRARLAFLQWACDHASADERGNLPVPVPGGYDEVVKAAYQCDQASDRLTRLVYTDLLTLIWQYGVRADALARRLERFVKRT